MKKINGLIIFSIGLFLCVVFVGYKGAVAYGEYFSPPIMHDNEFSRLPMHGQNIDPEYAKINIAGFLSGSKTDSSETKFWSHWQEYLKTRAPNKMGVWEKEDPTSSNEAITTFPVALAVIDSREYARNDSKLLQPSPVIDENENIISEFPYQLPAYGSNNYPLISETQITDNGTEIIKPSAPAEVGESFSISLLLIGILCLTLNRKLKLNQ